MAAALQLINLTKRFGSHPAVNAIDLEIPQGMLYAFLGPNGAGKSTTLKSGYPLRLWRVTGWGY